MLITWTKSAFAHRRWPPIKVILGLDDKVVGSIAEFVDWDGDAKPYRLTNFDHADMKAPDAWTQSTIIDEVRQALR